MFLKFLSKKMKKMLRRSVGFHARDIRSSGTLGVTRRFMKRERKNFALFIPC